MNKGCNVRLGWIGCGSVRKLARWDRQQRQMQQDGKRSMVERVWMGYISQCEAKMGYMWNLNFRGYWGVRCGVDSKGVKNRTECRGE
jgi:hypothetical protein